MDSAFFEDFLVSSDTLRVYEDSRLLFSSAKDGLLPLLEYSSQGPSPHRPVVIFDKIMGNAAALLSVRVGCQKVYSPLGSRIGLETLEARGIKHHISEIVDCILQSNGIDMCPMEKLSLGKDPEEFYKAVSNIIKVK
jgi:hypothetical protein